MFLATLGLQLQHSGGGAGEESSMRSRESVDSEILARFCLLARESLLGLNGGLLGQQLMQQRFIMLLELALEGLASPAIEMALILQVVDSDLRRK